MAFSNAFLTHNALNSRVLSPQTEQSCLVLELWSASAPHVLAEPPVYPHDGHTLAGAMT